MMGLFRGVKRSRRDRAVCMSIPPLCPHFLSYAVRRRRLSEKGPGAVRVFPTVSCRHLPRRAGSAADVAIPARLVVSLRHPSWIEAGAMRADPPSDRRMALHAVTLRVTRGAALEPLARRLPVLEQPDRLGIVEGDVATP
jgi:hypothetical protein